MNKRLVLENKIGTVIFGLLAIGGLCGICAGAWHHIVTVCVCLVVSWALWREAKELNH